MHMAAQPGSRGGPEGSLLPDTVPWEAWFHALAPVLLLGYYPFPGKDLCKPCPTYSAMGERCKNVIKVTLRVPGCG